MSYTRAFYDIIVIGPNRFFGAWRVDVLIVILHSHPYVVYKQHYDRQHK
jgi:hypothetical protein